MRAGKADCDFSLSEQYACLEHTTYFCGMVLDALLDTDAPECTALVWLQGEVKDALFDQMLKGS